MALLNPGLPMDPKITKTQLKCYKLTNGLLYLRATLETDLYTGDQDYGAIHMALLNPGLPMDPKITKPQLKRYKLTDGLLYLRATLETNLPRLCIPHHRSEERRV